MGNYTCHADGYEKLFQTHTLQVNGKKHISTTVITSVFMHYFLCLTAWAIKQVLPLRQVVQI